MKGRTSQCDQSVSYAFYLKCKVKTIDRAELMSSGLPSRVLRIPPYLCCGPAFRHHPLRRTDKILCRCFGAPVRQAFPDHLITDIMTLLYAD